MNLSPLPDYSIYWDLPVLIIVVSLVYSATRYDDWGAIVREALRWGLRMTSFLGGIGVALYFLSWWVDSALGWWVPILVGGVVLLVMLLFYVFFTHPETSPR